MTRSVCVGLAAFLWFASAVTAQPSSAMPGRPSDACRAVSDGSTLQLDTGSAPVAGSATRPPCSFGGLPLRIGPGEPVHVVDVSGRKTRGRVMTLWDAILTVRVDDVRHEFRAADVVQVDRRRRDPVWNGVLIGAAARALLGFGVGRSIDSPSCPALESSAGKALPSAQSAAPPGAQSADGSRTRWFASGKSSIVARAAEVVLLMCLRAMCSL